MSDKKFSGTEVFEMTWAVIETLESTLPNRIGSKSLPASIVADAVRMLLEDDSSPVGLRVEAKPDGPGGLSFLHWTSTKRFK